MKKNIDELNDREGIWQSDMSRIATITEEYYTYLFTTSHLRNMEMILEAVDKVVTHDMAHSLTQPHSEEEVKVALFSMHPSKSPGLDGISPFFFQKYWHIVGHDVMLTVLSVLHSSRCLKKMNFTHIVLIPKKNDPQYITKFRPISLSNVISQIISKVLANQKKSILPNIISDA